MRSLRVPVGDLLVRMRQRQHLGVAEARRGASGSGAGTSIGRGCCVMSPSPVNPQANVEHTLGASSISARRAVLTMRTVRGNICTMNHVER